MDARMRKAFTVWYTKRVGRTEGAQPPWYEIVEWTLEYLRTQQEPDALSDEEVDRLLLTPIPGGSTVAAWFLPHESERGLANVRDVIRRIVAENPQPYCTNPIPPSVPEGWQPMSTAPIDGTTILARLSDSDVVHTVRFENGWVIAWDNYALSSHDGPLAWMPMPAAPKPESKT